MSEEDLENEIEEFDRKYGKPLNLEQCITSKYPKMSIAAEFKRASPSKGDINPNLDAVTQCLEYAKMGAAVISVLTEFPHFKGHSSHAHTQTVHTRTHTHAQTHAHTHTHAQTHTHTHAHTHAHTCTHAHTHAHTHMYTHTHTRTHAHTRMYAHTNV